MKRFVLRILAIAAVGLLWPPSFTLGYYLHACTTQFGFFPGIGSALYLGVADFLRYFPAIAMFVMPLAVVVGLFAFGVMTRVTSSFHDTWIAATVVAVIALAIFLGASVSIPIETKCA